MYKSDFAGTACRILDPIFGFSWEGLSCLIDNIRGLNRYIQNKQVVCPVALNYLSKYSLRRRKKSYWQHSRPVILDRGHLDLNYKLFSAYKLVVVALIISEKYTIDMSHNNLYWASVSGLDLQDINESEIFFLKNIDYRLRPVAPLAMTSFK